MESYDETIDRLLTAYGIKSTNEAKQIIKQAGAVASGNLSPALLGWDGLVSENDMLAIQFRSTGAITQLNNVQTTLSLSIQ